ncbi:uncharacterized protein LOC121595722 [Anopheles merus]|uniref:uncharacterized protein LOC121595722 n=1 Tax=Anopheles merus TaxID=30066 RepID=UPI001BE45755|nr:uncharacterized protein LOC121595722 [Anopheles merus]XP_041775839.1 uncharacterized protein LOC121595722 [Anopheles merus]XP_041775840.1 uncharacterized protein LOC121595722 [Anopheles merus]XP_041775841.1 uncharacterized protein LOC121595722 [Anopheles merus]
MDHLEHLGGSIDGHQDMSKAVLRTTLQSTDSGSLHFITSTGMSHAGREQEYIESTLLGTDLLSSQLPTNLLNDYINSVSSSTTSSIGMQSALMEHHYRPFGTSTEELHSLTSETSKEAANTKDIPGFSTLSSYDKMMHIGQSSSPISNGLGQIGGTIDSYVHFPLHATSSGGDGFDVMANALATVTTHQQQQGEHQQQHHHHHYSLPHATSSHLHLQHQAQGHLLHHQSIVELSNGQLGHSDVPSSSSMGTLLPSVDVTLKAYSHNSSLLPIVSSAPLSSDVHSSSTMAINTMSLNESSKRFFSCATLPSLLPHNQRTIFTVAADSLAASKSVAASIMECESRTHDDDMAECAASIESVSCAQLGNINLPHKKRLAKKMTDTKDTFCGDVSEMDQSLMLANIQLSHRDATVTGVGSFEPTSKSNYGPSSSLHPGNNGKGNTPKAQQSPSATQHPGNSFSCQLCGKVIQDQRMFFNHLKEHYEPSLTPVNGNNTVDANRNATAMKVIALSTQGALDGKKAKPKLPRVKYTKKLKNDRTMKQGQATEEQNPAQNSDAKALLSTSTSSSASCAKTVESLLQHQALNDAMIVLECSENGGEFSETEDMLEGIRNVVQKVQETVDTDTTEELCIANSADWFPNQANDANNGSAVAAGSTPTTAMQQPEKCGHHMALSGESLDSHEIHIPSGGDNFLLLLSKAQFNDAELLQTESADTTLLKPLDAATCEQLTNSSSLNGSSRNETYVPGLPSAEAQNLQQLQPLHSTPFPLLSTVDALAESRAVSFQSNDSLNPLTSILLSSNTISKLSVASFAPSHCGQISDLRKTRLLKREQKSDEDDDYEPEAEEEEEEEENGKETSQYNEMQIIDLGASGVEPLNGESTGARNEPPIDDDYQCSDDEGAAASEEHFAPQVQGNEEEEEEEEEMCSNDKERRRATDAGSNAKVYKYLCPIEECGRWFKSKTAFSYHHLQHTGERPYQCQTCQKCFFTCSALKVHERLHSGEKPYKCEECGHHFRQWGDLKYHKISKHSNEKSHKCEFCGKEFARRYSLVLHRRIHTNEKNFVCEYCNKAFRASTYLQAHRMIHTGEKPHQCSLCDKKFRCHGDLNRHQKTHSRPGKGGGTASKQVDEDEDGSSTVELAGSGAGKLPSTPVDAKTRSLKRKTIAQKNNNSIVIV